MREAFAERHPLVNFIYLLSVMLFAMFLTNPVCMVISLMGSFAYSHLLASRSQKAGTRKKGGVVLLPILAVVIMTPLFSHDGVTVLGYFPSGNALTLEAILYGLICGCLLATMILWLKCAVVLLPSERLIYLCGETMPSLALVFTMSLRFVPMFVRQFRQVMDAQRAMGKEPECMTWHQKIRFGADAVSIMLTWALEHAVITADSMKARGYGLENRTFYRSCRWTGDDKVLLVLLALLDLGETALILTGQLKFWYYPALTGKLMTPGAIAGYLILACLCLIPVGYDRKEERLWKKYESNI